MIVLEAGEQFWKNSKFGSRPVGDEYGTFWL